MQEYEIQDESRHWMVSAHTLGQAHVLANKRIWRKDVNSLGVFAVRRNTEQEWRSTPDATKPAGHNEYAALANRPKPNLYPVQFEGRLWNEGDCSDVFASFYTCRAALAPDMSVYVGDGVRVYPDGSMMSDDGRVFFSDVTF